MAIASLTHQTLTITTDSGISIHNLTSRLQDVVTASKVSDGYALIFARHTTTAIAINEDEARLLIDLKQHLCTLAPPAKRYFHNDLHLREVPEDEPINAHAHLMAMMLSTSEMIPIMDGKLLLGTWQSVLFLDLDGPRQRSVYVQVAGERQE
jgi:secondary thiamine-phosphate synthase enzyme